MDAKRARLMFAAMDESRGAECEPPVTITDNELGDDFGVALAAEAGALGWDEVFAELFWWQELKSADLESIDVNQRDR